MAWTEEADSSKWTQKLENGTSATGAVTTVNVNMGALEYSRWDAEKAGAILDALVPVLDKSLYKSVRSVDYKLMSDD